MSFYRSSDGVDVTRNDAMIHPSTPEHEMQVTAATKTAEGHLFNLSNGDALLMKESQTCGGKTCVYPVYMFSNGQIYSARTGRYSATTIAPAMAAVRRYQA